MRNHTSKIYMDISNVFIVCLILSNIIAGRLFVIKGISLPAAVILFPVTYIIGDVVAEVYGFALSRRMIITGVLLNIFASVIFAIATNLPAPTYFNNVDAYAIVLGVVPRVTVASLLGFFVGSISNAAVMSIVRKLTNGRFLFVRTILSTLVGEGLDTGIFISISFLGTIPFANMLSMMIFQYCFKVLYEAIFTPILYRVIKIVKDKETTA